MGDPLISSAAQTLLEGCKSSPRPTEHIFLQPSPKPTAPLSNRVFHLHIAADWEDFLSDHHLPSTPSELDQVTTKHLFVDRIVDTPRFHLYKSHMWMRRREYHDGNLEWSLKRNFDPKGDEIEYEETKNVDEILDILRRDANLELSNQEDLDIAFTVLMAWLPTVRVTINLQPSLYFETVKLAGNCYYSLLTRTSTAPISTTKAHNRVLAKPFAYSYACDPEYYAKLRQELSLCPGTIPPLFAGATEPAAYLKSFFEELSKSYASQIQRPDYTELEDDQ